jgi:hypothetical protein
VVRAFGTPIEGSGFTSFAVGGQFGNYEIDFPPGTFNSCVHDGDPGPIITVTPLLFGDGAPRIVASAQTFCIAGGAARAHVVTVGADDGTLTADAFYFTAVQPS